MPPATRPACLRPSSAAAWRAARRVGAGRADGRAGCQRWAGLRFARARLRAAAPSSSLFRSVRAPSPRHGPCYEKSAGAMAAGQQGVVRGARGSAGEASRHHYCIPMQGRALGACGWDKSQVRTRLAIEPDCNRRKARPGVAWPVPPQGPPSCSRSCRPSGVRRARQKRVKEARKGGRRKAARAAACLTCIAGQAASGLGRRRHPGARQDRFVGACQQARLTCASTRRQCLEGRIPPLPLWLPADVQEARMRLGKQAPAGLAT